MSAIKTKALNNSTLFKNILIVDNNANWASAIRHCLPFYVDAEVACVYNGHHAIDLVKKGLIPFDLLIIDFHMPILNGFETILELRKIGYSRHIILASNDIDSDLPRKAREVGADLFVAKPKLLEHVVNYMEQHGGKMKQSFYAENLDTEWYPVDR